LLTRSIDIVDPFELTIEEKIFRAAKRFCIAFAVAAVMLAGLDLADIRSVENAADLLHTNRQRIADLPNLIRSGIQSIAIAAPTPAPYATALIPRNDIAIPLPPMRSAVLELSVTKEPSRVAEVTKDLSPVAEVTKKVSPLAELAAARHLDAVEVAMESPAAMTKSEPPLAAVSAPAAMIFASVDPAPPQLPSITPVSLPMAAAIPIDKVPLPPPAPGAPPPSPAERLYLQGAERAKAERCLSNAIYFEARDQPYRGQVAVAQVVINRVFSGVYPRDVCGVIYQNASRHLACQFTFACDGKRKTINEFGSWARARRIARETLDGQLYVPAVGTSTHYHAAYVHPNWVREMHRYAREGVHLFYRPIAWGNGSDEPIWSRAQLDAIKNKKVAANKKR